MWSAMCSLTIGSTSLNTLRPFCMNCMSRRSAMPSGRERRRKPLLLRMLLENCRGAACRLDLEAGRRWRLPSRSISSGGGHIAEDEMAIAVAPFQMRRADLGVDHQRGTDRTRAHHVGGGLDAERGRGAGDIHVEGKALDAQRMLDLDGDRPDRRVRGWRRRRSPRRRPPRSCRPGPAPSAAASTAISAITTASSSTRWRNSGMHHLRVENTGLVKHMALFDARGLDDEFLGGMLLGLDLAAAIASALLGVDTGRHRH